GFHAGQRRTSGGERAHAEEEQRQPGEMLRVHVLRVRRLGVRNSTVDGVPNDGDEEEAEYADDEPVRGKRERTPGFAHAAQVYCGHERGDDDCDRYPMWQ